MAGCPDETPPPQRPLCRWAGPRVPGFSPGQDRQAVDHSAGTYPLSARRAAEQGPLGSPCPVALRGQEKACCTHSRSVKGSGTSRLRGWEEGRGWDRRLLAGSLLVVHWDTHVSRLLLQGGVQLCATGPTGTAHAQDAEAGSRAGCLEGRTFPSSERTCFSWAAWEGKCHEKLCFSSNSEISLGVLYFIW